jgi:hypothetical protein
MVMVMSRKKLVKSSANKSISPWNMLSPDVAMHDKLVSDALVSEQSVGNGAIDDWPTSHVTHGSPLATNLSVT